MPDEEYYAEVLDSIPFSMTVNLFKRMMPAPLAFLLAGFFRCKYYLGIPSKPRHAFGPFGTAKELPVDQMPPRPMSRWAAKLEVLQDLGFRPVCYSVPDLIGAKEGASVLLLDEPGSTFAIVEWQLMEAGGDELSNLAIVELDTFLADDNEICTAMVPEDQLALADAFPIEHVDQLFLADSQSLRKVYQQHRERIQRKQPMHYTMENAKVVFDKHNQGRFDCLLKLGVIKRLKPKEIQYVKQQRLPQ